MDEPNVGPFGQMVTMFTLTDPPPPTVSRREFETVKNWAENWLSKCHPDLGRSGAVCPFSGSSIKKNLFRVAVIRGTDFDHNRMVALLEDIAAGFPLLPPTDGPDSIYKAIVLVFPDVSEFAQIDAVQDECKTTFVNRGLMVGQFYPGHQQGGLRNPDFKALDAPFAMLAVRQMVVTDYPFLSDNAQWMAAYHARFAPNGTTGCPNGRRGARTKSFGMSTAPGAS